MKTSLMLAAVVAAFAAEAAALEMHRNDEWRSVPVERVRLDGPLGRRIALTATNNLMKIDLEKDFFKPFREKTANGGFIGLGKLLDGAAYLAKYTGFKDVVERKREIARVLADTQDADGYIGYFAPEARMRKLWDLHEIGFILQGLVSDWELFGERRSLDAARKAADYVMRRWPDMPDGWEFDDITDRETTLDPAQLVFKANADGGRSAFCGTAIATRCTTVDYARRIGPGDPEILLTEFADEDDTLTYFRTPVPDSPLLVDDELFVAQESGTGRRN